MEYKWGWSLMSSTFIYIDGRVHRVLGIFKVRKIAQESEKDKSHIWFRQLALNKSVWKVAFAWSWTGRGGLEKQLLFGWLFSSRWPFTHIPPSCCIRIPVFLLACRPCFTVWLVHFYPERVLFSSKAGTPRSKPPNTNHVLLFPLWALCFNEHAELWAFVLPGGWGSIWSHTSQ